jgi:hypothetical protein
MPTEGRTEPEVPLVGLATELFHAPVCPMPKVLDALHNTLSKWFPNKEKKGPDLARFYTEAAPEHRQELVLRTDRLLLVETGTQLSIDPFSATAREVALAVLNAFSFAQFDKHTVTLRCAFSPKCCVEGRTFVLDHLCGQEGMAGVFFQRPVTLSSIRLLFADTPVHHGTYRITIESSLERHAEVHVEVLGQFTTPRVSRTTTSRVAKNFGHTHEFLTQRVIPFLVQYDVPGDRL